MKHQTLVYWGSCEFESQVRQQLLMGEWMYSTIFHPQYHDFEQGTEAPTAPRLKFLHFWLKLNLSFFKAPLHPLTHDLQKPFWRCIPLPSVALPHCTHMKRPTYQSPTPHTAPELLRSSPFPPVRVCGRFGFSCSALTGAGSQYFCFNNAVIMPAVLFLSLSRSQWSEPLLTALMFLPALTLSPLPHVYTHIQP